MAQKSMRIRMYRQGLGDCFLLSFPRQDGEPDFNMLVDCGVLQHTDTSKILKAVEDIGQTTGGHLDLVVMTHEHEDHISGFRQAQETFKNIKVDQVWLGWTEDPENPVAMQLRKDRHVRLNAVRAALTQMAKMNLNSLTEKDLARVNEQKDGIEQLMRFFGEESGAQEPEGAGLAAAGSTDAASKETPKNPMVEFALAKGADITYCYPTRTDRPHILEIVPGVRAYIFGPPEDPSIFSLMDPTKKGKETYSQPAFGVDEGFIAAATDSSDAGSDSSLRFPFDDLFRIPAEEAKKSIDHRFFQRHYGFGKYDTDKYRRIDGDWLDITNELALKLVDGTNNTSLVLAIEIGEPGRGKVLLLAADAQVGNWLSWGPLKWTFDNPGGAVQTVTTRDVLGRTVLYKVGHHGSDNATMRAQGLELMPDDNLVAMIPVDEDAASHVNGDNKPGWRMPASELYARLKEKTKGRVLRADLGLPSREDTAKLADAEWDAFLKAATLADIYVEFNIDAAY